MLIERRQRLETSIEGLEQGQIRLSSALIKKTFRDQQIMIIKEFSGKVTKGLAIADTDNRAQRQALAENNFSVKRKAIEALNATITLSVEDGQKVIYLHWMPGSLSLPVPPTPSLPLVSDNTISRDALVRTRQRPYH